MSQSVRPLPKKNERTFTDWRIGLIGVFALAVLIYLPSLKGEAIWDDISLLNGSQFGGNDFHAAFFHPFGNYFRPLTSASFVLDSMFAKGVPFFYHQTNILLHAFAAVLVAILAFLITDRKLAGILAGVFFAFQPMQVSAVAWIGGRTDALSTFFIAGFLVCLVLSVRPPKAISTTDPDASTNPPPSTQPTPEGSRKIARWSKTPGSDASSIGRTPQGSRNRKLAWMLLAATCYLLGALAKEQVAAIIPVVPFAFIWIGKLQWKAALKKSAPYLVPFLIYVGFYLFKGPIPQKVSNGFLDTVTLSLRTDAFYGFGFLVPTTKPLVTYTLENYTGVGWMVLGAAFVLAFAWLFVRAAKNYPKMAWLALCGLLLYLPVCNFPTLPSMVVATYRLANGGILIACLFGMAAAYFVRRQQYLYAGILGLNLLVGLGVTWWGVHQWMTVKGFFEVVAKNDPHFLVGVLDYTQALDKDGNHKEAIERTDQTIAWFFDTPDWLDKLEKQKAAAVTPEVYRKLQSNFGMPMLQTLGNFVGQNAYFLARDGQIARARRVARMAQVLAARDPWVQDLYARLIFPVDKQEAIKDWKIALQLNPQFADPAVSLGQESMRERHFGQAQGYFEQALKTIPYSGEVWAMRARANIAQVSLGAAADSLDQAEHATFPADKNEVAELRREIEAEKESASRQRRLKGQE